MLLTDLHQTIKYLLMGLLDDNTPPFLTFILGGADGDLILEMREDEGALATGGGLVEVVTLRGLSAGEGQLCLESSHSKNILEQFGRKYVGLEGCSSITYNRPKFNKYDVKDNSYQSMTLPIFLISSLNFVRN